jgi:hypothetical protein
MCPFVHDTLTSREDVYTLYTPIFLIGQFRHREWGKYPRLRDGETRRGQKMEKKWSEGGVEGKSKRVRRKEGEQQLQK